MQSVVFSSTPPPTPSLLFCQSSGFQTRPSTCRHPVKKQIVQVGGIVTFTDQEHLSGEPDAAFLNSIENCFCAYGACDCPIYPFTCTIERHGHLPTGRQVLQALWASSFKSEHIVDLNTESLPYPGYHPQTDNDEIHTDPESQSIFSKEQTGDYTETLHASLKDKVVDGHLFYVLLHDTPEKHNEFWFSEWVVLFAIGVSKKTGNLIGILTHQACHNYCD